MPTKKWNKMLGEQVFSSALTITDTSTINPEIDYCPDPSASEQALDKFQASLSSSKTRVYE
jgi:hypothetical protein